MQELYVDTNVIVSFLTNRSHAQSLDIQKSLQAAKDGTLRLFIVSEIVLESAYVLRRYNLTHKQIARQLLSLIKSPIFIVPEKDLLIAALGFFEKFQIDLTDCLLYARAKNVNAGIYTFDKDFSMFD